MDSLNRHNRRRTEGGFSTLEIMIALSIMVITLSGVLLVTFGPQMGSSGVFGLNFQNQALLLNGQISAEALNKAQEMLEEEQALARKDFNLVVSTTTVDIDPSTGFRFDREVLVEALPDFLTKKVTVRVKWKDVAGIDRQVELTTLLTNFNNSVGGDTCSSVLSGNWSNPVTTSFSLQSITGASGYTVSDVDAYKGRLYVTVSKTPNPTDPILFVFNIANPSAPTLLGSYDNAVDVDGYNAIRVSENLDDGGKLYAYLAHASSTAQFQVLDVSNPAFPGTPHIASLRALNVTGANAFGKSIFYKNGYAFLGLTATGGTGPEFHVIAVGNASSPFEVGQWPGSSLGNDINALWVSEGNAYIATPDTTELHVLSVTNPVKPKEIGSYSAGTGNGKSLYGVGDTLYFGRTVSSNELVVLDATTPATLDSSNPSPRSFAVGSSVVDVIVRDTLAFFLTTKQGSTDGAIKILNTSTGASVTTSLPGVGPSGVALDCEGNALFAGSNDASGNGSIVSIVSGT